MEENVVSDKQQVIRGKEAKAYGRYLHIAPTKITDLMRLVRGKTITEAETILKFSGRRGADSALKVLKSAEANAGNGLVKDQWVITEAQVGKGPLYRRRVNPRSRGQADIMRSPSAHITIVISLPAQAGKKQEAKKEKHGPQA